MDGLGAFSVLWCLHHARELLQPGVSLLQVGCTSTQERVQLALVAATAVANLSHPGHQHGLRLFAVALTARIACKLAELPFVFKCPSTAGVLRPNPQT